MNIMTLGNQFMWSYSNAFNIFSGSNKNRSTYSNKYKPQSTKLVYLGTIGCTV